MKTINRLFLLITLIALSACAAQKKQVKPEAAAQPKAVSEAEAAKAAAEVKPQEAVKPAEVKAPAVTVYIVKGGDTLERIAKLPSVYGDRNMWPVIYEANRNQLSHPSKIYPGQRLRIPRDLNEISTLKKRAQMNKVRQTADQASREARLFKERQLAAKAAQSAPAVSAPSTAAPVAPAAEPVAPAAETAPSAPAAPSASMSLPVVTSGTETAPSSDTDILIEEEDVEVIEAPEKASDSPALSGSIG
jgi:LysM repeat protein